MQTPSSQHVQVPPPWSDKVSEVLLSKQEISRRNIELGKEIGDKYHGCNPILIGVLKGSIIFLADLTRAIDIEHELQFIRASSYHGTESSGKVKIQGLENVDLKGRHVLLVEDIVDTGLTLKHIVDHLESMGPASLKICSFLSKNTKRRLPGTPNVDFIAHYIPDKFVVGYGLDVDQRLRHLPFLGIYKNTK